MYKRDKDYEKGRRLEWVFHRMLDKIGITYIPSTDEEDRVEGWDLRTIYAPPNCDTLAYKYFDVKGVKDKDNKYNWIELVAYSSKKQKLGWLLRGKAEFIAFHMADSFIIVEKSKIKEFVYSKLPQLKDYETEALQTSNGQEDFELRFLSIINANWSNFVIIDKKEDKFKALYNLLYSRPQYDHEPDLLFRLKNTDLINMSVFRIKK